MAEEILELRYKIDWSYDKNSGDSGSQSCPRMFRGINQEDENVAETSDFYLIVLFVGACRYRLTIKTYRK